jgi:hypothetical protein
MNRQTEIEKLAAETTSDPRWLLLVARDKESDGKFFYSVKTTGVYCRPSCAALRIFLSRGLKVPFWRELQRLFSQPICRLKDLLLSWLVYFRQVTGCRRPRLAIEYRGFRNLTQSRSIRRRSS